MTGLRKGAATAAITGLIAVCTIAGLIGDADGGVTRARADEANAANAILTATERLRSAEAYVARTSGKTVAKKGFISYEQKIGNTMIGRRGVSYSRSESSSAFVKVVHEAYASGGRVAYRTNDGCIETSSEAEYASVYGFVPSPALNIHDVRRDTIVSARAESAGGGTVVYSFELSRPHGTAALARQMKKFAGLKELPEFTDNSRLTLTVAADGTPLTFSAEDSYTIKFGILGKLKCTQSLTCEYSFARAEIPDEAAFSERV